jgi:hypothetical protein
MTAATRIQALAFVAASMLPLAFPLAAQALAIKVGGTDYEVSFSSIAYKDNPALFAATTPGQMAWWGNPVLAATFAAEVYDQLGVNVYQAGYGAVFAYDYNPAGLGEVYGIAQNTLDINDQLALDSANPLAASATHPYAFAIANAPVPGPLPLFGAAAGFGWARRLRKHQKLITNKLSSRNQQAG